MKLLSLLVAILLSQNTFAEVIEFPEEELASETVLPVFDKKDAVKNKNIQFDSRFELAAGLGFSLVEPLYENKALTIEGSYFFNEDHGFNVYSIFMLSGLSDTGKQLQEGRGLLGNQTFDASLSPNPEIYLLGNYVYNAFYGKISLTKKSVLNLSLYTLLGLGTVSFGDSNEIAMNFGVGQKIYFNQNFSLKMDLMLTTFEGPDPTSISDTATTKVSSSDLQAIRFYKTFFNISASYLF